MRFACTRIAPLATANADARTLAERGVAFQVYSGNETLLYDARRAALSWRIIRAAPVRKIPTGARNTPSAWARVVR